MQDYDQKFGCAEDAVPRILGGMQEGLNQTVISTSYLGAGRQSVPDLEQVIVLAPVTLRVWGQLWQGYHVREITILVSKATLHCAVTEML